MSQERRCQKQVWRGYGMGDGPAEAGHSQCRRRGKVEEDGKWWCSIHAPSAEANRLAKRAEKALPPTFLTEGYEGGYSAGWEAGKESAAKWHKGEAKELMRLSAPGLASKESRNNAKQAASEHTLYAAEIRKLKKP